MKQDRTLFKVAASVLLTAALAACEKPQLEAPAALDAAARKSNATSAAATDWAFWENILENLSLAGGATTVESTSADAFSLPASNLGGAHLTQHLEGRAGFKREFLLDQLAPVWNNDQCDGCHVGSGRSKAPQPGNAPQLLFRVSLPGKGPDGGPNPVPGFGDQIQPVAVVNGVRGVSIEGKVSTTYLEEVRYYIDGQSYSLRSPTYTFVRTPGGNALPAKALISPRIGPQVAGLGLLEAVPEATILALADEKDRDHDGISGRPNYVWDAAAQAIRLGRFGWKANQPTLLQQNAAAYNGDLGITTPYFPLESDVPGGGRNKEGRKKKKKDDHGFEVTETDISGQELDAVTFYTRTLGVPAFRNITDPLVVAGRTIFLKANCGACHVPTLRTGTLPTEDGDIDGILPTDVPEVAYQNIAPFTDLLLHNMGPGLADNRPDFEATGSEWRTPPLWGIGLTETVNSHSFFLHDGRARNLMEAIMWHGGEATESAEYVKGLPEEDRDALVAFLKSL